MKILANTNNMMTAQHLEWYLKNSGIGAAAVWASADAEIFNILRAEKIDVLLYFPRQMDNRELVNLFFNICKVNSTIVTVLCVPAETLPNVGGNLKRSVDECIALPLSPADFTNMMQRCQRRRLIWNTPVMPVADAGKKPPEPEKQAVPGPLRGNGPAAGSIHSPEGVLPGNTAPAPVEDDIIGLPPAQTAAETVSKTPAMPQNPAARTAAAGIMPASKNAVYETPQASVPVAPPGRPVAELPASQTGPDSEKKKKNQSKLRSLKKRKLLAIIREQEERLEQLYRTIEELNSKLERMM